jgi:uncharacterized protein
MMFIGMALFKWGVFHATRSAGIYGAMVVLGYGLGLLVNWREMSIILSQQFSMVSFYEANITYDLGRIAMMSGHTGLVMLLCQSHATAWLLRPFAAAGRMALTNYLSQTVITTVIFVLFAQYGKWERHQLYFLVAGIWAFQLVASPLWLAHFHFGPMEWVWRSLTYLKKQPFRKKTGALTPREPAVA